MSNGGFITTYKNKFKRFLRDYGWWYTIRVSLMLLFGTKDPKYDARWPEKYEKHLSRMNCRNDEEKDKQIQPIDYYATLSTEPEIILIIEKLGENETEGYILQAIEAAVSEAAAKNAQLTVVSRNEVLDPSRFYTFLASRGVQKPQKTVFYSDCDRSADGKTCSKLRMGEKPSFYTAGWYCLAAAFATDEYAPINAALPSERGEYPKIGADFYEMLSSERVTVIRG